MPRSTRLRWIVFDAVGTLLSPDPAVADAYWLAGQRWGTQLSRNEVDRRFKAAFRDSESACFSVNRRGRTSEQEERQRWRWIVETVLPDVKDADACFQQLWDHFAEPSSWRCYDDVGPAVEALQSAGFQLAIASNFDGRLHRLCESSPVLSAIPLRLVSSEIGQRKPARDFYEAVVAACRAEPAEILFVGDDQQSDYLAPLECGLAAVWLNRRSVAGKETIGSLADLPLWLAQGHNPAA